MNFRIEPLPTDTFHHLYGLDDAGLQAHGAEAVIADVRPGFPCRVSLRDAEPGERVLLLNFEHLPGATPFRSRHAIFVREHAQTARVDTGVVPESLRQRLLSIRAFDARQRMVDADVVEGRECEPVMQRLLAMPGVTCLHLHAARPGCYLARAVPAQAGAPVS